MSAETTISVQNAEYLWKDDSDFLLPLEESSVIPYNCFFLKLKAVAKTAHFKL